MIQDIEKEGKTDIYIETGKYPAYNMSSVLREMIYSIEYDISKDASNWQFAVSGNIKVFDDKGLDCSLSYGFSRQDIVPGEKAGPAESKNYFTVEKDGRIWHFTVTKSF